MTRKNINILALFLIGGLLWYASFMLFFVLSGAQNILASPEHQSGKFLTVFTKLEPLPRDVETPRVLYAGIYVISSITLIVFLQLIDKLQGNWLTKGIRFGLINWALTIPWFEFYLLFNVMHEPFKLVLLEALLWLFTLISVAIVFSFIYHSKAKEKPPLIIVEPETEVLTYRGKS